MEPYPRNCALSLADLAGTDYTESVCAARAVLGGEDRKDLEDKAREPVDLYPTAFATRCDELLEKVGTSVSPSLPGSNAGAGSAAFEAATKTSAAPLSAMGCFRIGEDGYVRLTTKAEHYHLSVGHAFPGYDLIARAKALGIPNATHNNTRGHITRLLEDGLVQAANPDTRRLSRVINLQTGSLAMEAAIKILLNRFFRSESEEPKTPLFHGRVPVLLVIAGNYHGTAMVSQLLRGMWPELGCFEVRAIPPNDLDQLRAALEESDTPPRKAAGFIHEIVLMNLGALTLNEAFLEGAYAMCRVRDVPVVADEVQTCMWSPELFMFREYGLEPDLVALGKGFSGGENAGSRVITTPAMDGMQQFGALVTNGQEELTSLAYLITMAFAQRNRDYILHAGDRYRSGLEHLAKTHSDRIERIEGRRHLASLFFDSLETTRAFVDALTARGLDISVQTYKADCPPSALTKLPLTASVKMIDFVLAAMDAALEGIGR